MKRVIFVVAIFAVGAVSGGFVEHLIYDDARQECASPAALKGCELTAIDVNNMLTDCEWRLSNTEHKLLQQLEQ